MRGSPRCSSASASARTCSTRTAAGGRSPASTSGPVVTQIDSDRDPRLSPFRDVGHPAALERAGLFVGEGRLVVERLIRDGRFAIESVLVTPAAFDALHAILGSLACPVLVTDPSIVRGITGFDFHRGCLALARRPSQW